VEKGTVEQMRFYKNPEVVRYTPFLTTALLEISTFSHIIQMWTKGTSAGQSVIGFVLVICALILWFNWYGVFTPDQKFARYSTLFGIVMSSIAFISVLIFR
jgi:hypothetical protein